MNTQLIQSGGLQQVYDTPQVVYLDFDGEQTSYNGEILTIDQVQVEDSGLTKERIQQITASLNEQFAGQNVLFVSDLSDYSDKNYSTIYIGKTDSFSEYGHFAGLAETVDTGNKIKNDNAFVILDSASDNAQIIGTIAHEAGHLLGTLDHGGEGLQRYASSYIVSSGVTSTGVILESWEDSMSVLDGGVASNTTNSDGRMYISSGGTASETTLNGGDMVNYGSANIIDVNSNGYITVYGGHINSATLNEGTIWLSYNASASNTIINNGSMDVSWGGHASNTTIHSGGSLFVSSGGTATGIIADEGAKLDFTVALSTWIQGTSNGSAFETKNGYLSGYTVASDCALSVASGGTATDIIVEDGAQLDFSVAPNTYVQWEAEGSSFEMKDAYLSGYTVSQGCMRVESGGSMDNTTVSSGGTMHVSYGGLVNKTAIDGGEMTVSGSANDVNIHSWGRVDVYGNVDNVDVGYGYIDVYDGGSLNNTTLNEDGHLWIYDGGSANNTTVNSGGTLSVMSGGTALNVNWTPCVGYVDLASGAVVTYTSQYSGVYFDDGSSVSSSAVIDDVQVGAAMYVMSDGVANRATVVGDMYVMNGGTANSTTLEYGSMSVMSGGTANDTTVESGSYLTIMSGGTALNLNWTPCVGYVDVDPGAVVTYASQCSGVFLGNYGELSSAAVMNDQVVNGSMYIMKGGTANNTTLYGAMYVSSGGMANNTTVDNYGRMFVRSGGTAKKITVNSEGSLSIASGGTATDIIAENAASLNIVVAPNTLIQGTLNSSAFAMKNACLSGYSISSGGDVQVLSGGTVTEVAVSYGGAVRVSSGGTANKTNILDGALFIEKGGIANSATLNSWGSILVSSGGTAADTLLNGGYMYVSGGGTANKTSVFGRLIIESGMTSYYPANMFVLSGGTANSTTLKDAGELIVSSGGTANNTTVKENGHILVSSGGTASNTVLSGSTSKYVISGSSQILPVYGTMEVQSGGTANSTTVKSNGYLNVSSGGTAMNITAENGAMMNIIVASNTYMQGKSNGSAFEFKNGYLSGYTINSGGTVWVASDGTATGTTVNSGGNMFLSGGNIKNTVINSKGYVNIIGGGSANQTTIHSKGKMYIMSGGTATNIIAESGAGLDIGVTSNTYVQGKYNGSSFEMKDACLSNYTIYNKGGVIVHSDGKVNNIRVSSGGYFHLLSGGTATNLVVDKDAELTLQVAQDTYLQGTLNGSAIKMQDGVLSGFTVYSKSYLLSVVSGGKAIGTTVNSKGGMILNGGVASNTIVNSGGHMAVYGGTLSGTLNIASGAEVGFYNYGWGEEGVTIDFTVAEQSKPSTALINNWSLISNASSASYTITVKANQEEGDYVLAGKASGFANTITVKTVEGTELGKISVGESLFKNNVLYTLNNKSGNLQLTIEENGPVPTPTESTTKSIAWTGVEGCSKYIVQYSADNFEHSLTVSTAETGLENCGLPKGKWQWRVRTETSSKWQYGDPISKTYSHTTPEAVSAQENGVSDIFFLSSQGTWEEGYAACNVGSFEWQGTNEKVSLEGKNRFSDTITGNTDLNLLVLTDDKNGDALFVDDIFTEFPDEQQSRFVQIDEIRAGAGDDIVDMTSQRFECDDLTVRGGAGNDTIWANKGDNMLFGDAGNDSIVGASGNDVIAGGSGNDTLHGGGGNDTFTFSSNWGSDTVEQLSDGTVTLWFASGSESKWDEKTLTYTDGKNSVKVTGVSAENVTLKFGDDESEEFDSLTAAGAFLETSSENAFEEKDKGFIASL